MIDKELHEVLDSPAGAVGDWTSIGIVLGTIANILPSIAALLSIIWLALRIWESDTVRGWTNRETRRYEDKSD